MDSSQFSMLSFISKHRKIRNRLKPLILYLFINKTVILAGNYSRISNKKHMLNFQS